jgi:cyclopropane fatty-acyl-phospholipid synthase-like methyltransferase
MRSVCQPRDFLLPGREIALNRQEFFQKFDDVTGIIQDWCGPLHGKTVLDFGCGEGVQIAGIAKRCRPLRAIGVDINAEYKRLAQICAEHGEAPAEIEFHTIKPGDRLSSRLTGIDLIYSWSVFEHIDQRILRDVVGDLRDTLSKDGRLFVQIAPLYFSPEGG